MRCRSRTRIPTTRSSSPAGVGVTRRARGKAGLVHQPCLAPVALKLASSYAVVRAVRLLQEHGPLPGGDGLVVRGVHVHHCVHGVVLVGAQHLVRRHLSRPVRENLLAVGCALVLDELDVLLQCEQWTGAPRRRRLDGGLLVSLLAVAVAGGVRTPAHAVAHWRH